MTINLSNIAECDTCGKEIRGEELCHCESCMDDLRDKIFTLEEEIAELEKRLEEVE